MARVRRAPANFVDWLGENWEFGNVGPAVKARLRNGNNGDVKEASRFIPKAKLQRYFEEDKSRLRDILGALFFRHGIPDTIDEHIILRDYIQVFAILLFIRKGKYIELFIEHHSLADQKLPFAETAPREFPQELSYSAGKQDDFFPLFYKEQWHFWIPTLEWRKHVLWQPNCILPILYKEAVGSGASATSYRVEVYPDYNALRVREKTPLTPEDDEYNTFVLKCYRAEDRKDRDYEVAAFLQIRKNHRGSSDVPGLIGFYGSFQQDGFFFILLEYANMSNLDEYFENNPQPTMSLSQRQDFWISFFETLKALSVIHGEQGHAELKKPGMLRGWHQDVKPRNILVCRRRQGTTDRLEFKLADLGLSHFRNGEKDVNVPGACTYAAPESYLRDRFDYEHPIPPVTPKVDVWSLGAVLSEIATWLASGMKGLDSYRQSRRDETMSVPNFKHVRLRWELAQEGDRTTTAVVIMADQMLLEEDYRKNSRFFYIESTKILHRNLEQFGFTGPGKRRELPFQPTIGETKPGSSSSIHPEQADKGALKLPRTASRTGEEFDASTSSIVESPPNGSENTVLPISLHRSASPTSMLQSHVSSNSSMAIEQPFSIPPPTWSQKDAEADKSRCKRGADLDEDLRRDLHDRDIIILIDDSVSMRKHWLDVISLFELLAHFLVDFDDDGIEVLFTNNPRKFRSKDVNDLVNEVKQAVPPNSPTRRTDIDHVLLPFLQFYQRRLRSPGNQNSGHNSWARKLRERFRPSCVKRLSVYVLTDGDWQQMYELNSEIVRTIDTLIDTGRHRTQFGMQFIRFGSSELGYERLKKIDLLRSVRDENKDVTDTVDATGDFRKMLLGAINPWYGEDPDDRVSSGKGPLKEADNYHQQQGRTTFVAPETAS